MPYTEAMFSQIDGTLVNFLTVLVGGTLGVLVGSKFPQRFQNTIFSGLGLFTVLVGVQMALTTNNALIMLGSLLLGGLIGEWLRIEQALDRLGLVAQARFARHDSKFSEAFVASSLLFCVGPLTVVGSLRNGLSGDPQLLLLKSTLDLFSSFAFGASLGVGVLASTVTVLVVEGGLSLGAGALSGVLTKPAITELSAVGGLMIIGIGIQLLRLREIPVANFLPALVVAPVLVTVIRALSPLLHNVSP